MSINFNNVYLTYRGFNVSIAQHRTEGKAIVQEVYAYLPEGDHCNIEPIVFETDTSSLIGSIKSITDRIDAYMDSERTDHD